MKEILICTGPSTCRPTGAEKLWPKGSCILLKYRPSLSNIFFYFILCFKDKSYPTKKISSCNQNLFKAYWIWSLSLWNDSLWSKVIFKKTVSENLRKWNSWFKKKIAIAFSRPYLHLYTDVFILYEYGTL